MERKSCCGARAVAKLTPEQHQQVIMDTLKACSELFETWLAEVQWANPTIERADAVKLVHQHIGALIAAASPGVAPYAADSPMGDPAGCLNQYQACIAAGGSQQTCYNQYLSCLGRM